MHETLVPFFKRKNQSNLQKHTCSVNASSVSWTSIVKPNSLRQITMQKNKGPLTVSDNQLSAG